MQTRNQFNVIVSIGDSSLTKPSSKLDIKQPVTQTFDEYMASNYIDPQTLTNLGERTKTTLPNDLDILNRELEVRDLKDVEIVAQLPELMLLLSKIKALMIITNIPTLKNLYNTIIHDVTQQKRIPSHRVHEYTREFNIIKNVYDFNTKENAKQQSTFTNNQQDQQDPWFHEGKYTQERKTFAAIFECLRTQHPNAHQMSAMNGIVKCLKTRDVDFAHAYAEFITAHNDDLNRYTNDNPYLDYLVSDMFAQSRFAIKTIVDESNALREEIQKRQSTVNNTGADPLNWRNVESKTSCNTTNLILARSAEEAKAKGSLVYLDDTTVRYNPNCACRNGDTCNHYY
jgi:hypothetical protein